MGAEGRHCGRGDQISEPGARLRRGAWGMEFRRAVWRFEQRWNARPIFDEWYISLDRNRSYWYDFSKVAGGNTAIIGDAKNWPAFEGRSLSGYQTKRVWLNDGAGKFVDVAQAVGVTDTYDGRAVAL